MFSYNLIASSLIKDLKKAFLPDKKHVPAIILCILFAFAYLLLALIKHSNFGTGYDLSIENQIVWQYSNFTLPVITVHAYSFLPVFHDHIEFIFAILAPFYWILPDARTLIVLQALSVVLSGYIIYLLAMKHKLNLFVSLSLLISYLMFFGVQNALWSDVHSLTFAVSFLAFFIYCLDTKRRWPSILFFILAITSKEDIGFIAFFISFIYLLRTREKINLFFMGASVVYVLFIYLIFYPYFTNGYIYAGESGLISNINLLNFINTNEKLDVFKYSFISTGFLPLLNPLNLLPYLADLGHYFVLGSEKVTSAQGIFMHYRITSALLLIWPMIFIIEKYNKLNTKYLALYIVFFAFLSTYLLHAPLTYLAKDWFWTTPSGVSNINKAIDYLPRDAYVASQTNIAPHISNRNLIVTVWGERKEFASNSPCEEKNCAWLKWSGKPEFLIVDISPEWDIRHLLANRPDFIEGLANMEKMKYIELDKEFGSAKIYKINY